MTEILEPVQPPVPPKEHDSSCPFCSKEPPPNLTSKIGKHNDPKELENNLAENGYARADVYFYHEDYGEYSKEPHHLVPGNEALKGHDIEAYLSTEAVGTFVDSDTGFNINHAKNGQWLPSITDENRICKWETIKQTAGGKTIYKRIPAASEKGKKLWSQLSEDEKDLISFAIMNKEHMQFHKGNHRNKGSKPDECYIKEVHRLLNGLYDYVLAAESLCPDAETAGETVDPPPYGLNELIYAVACGHMKWHVNGPAESWFVFISPLARRCYQYAIDEGKKPWDAPHPGHPNRA